MTEIAEFEVNQNRARAARVEARELRELNKIASCGLGMKYTGIHYGNHSVGLHIASRIADQYLTWADEYDAIASEIESGLVAALTSASRGSTSASGKSIGLIV